MFRVMVAASVFAAGLMPLAAQAKTDDWERIGTRVVDRTLDSTSVDSDGVFGRSTAVRVRVERGVIVLRDVLVTFGNGRTRDVFDRRRRRIEAGEEFTFNLRRGRNIKRVTFEARTARNAGRRARVSVQLQGEEQRIRPSQFEALELAEVRRDDERVVMQVGRNEGRFSVLRLRSLDASARIRSMTVTFGNGATERVDFRRRLNAGAETDDIVLPGRAARRIRSVDIRMRPQSRRNRLVLLGKQQRPERRPAARPSGRFVVLGDRLSDTRDERIVIPISGDRNPRSIRLQVENNGVRVRSVTVERRNGRSETIRVRERLADGETSDAIDLQRSSSVIDAITVRVRPSQRRGSVRMAVLAERSRRPDPPAIPRISDNRFGEQPRFRGDGPNYGRYMQAAQQRLSERRRRYVIDFGNDRRRYDGIALRALRGDARIRLIDVEYANGRKETLGLRRRLDRNDVTRLIKFDRARRLKSVAIEAQTARDSRRDPNLQVFVLRASTQQAAPVRERDGEWVLLGRQKAEMFSRDNDTFKVGRDYGRFDEIRVRARRTDITLYGMKVTFGNGSVEDVPLYGKLKKNRTTEAMKLRSRGRFIERISLKYRSRLSFRGEGRVEVWGRLASRDARPEPRNERRSDRGDDGRRLLRDILREFGQKFGQQ